MFPTNNPFLPNFSNISNMNIIKDERIGYNQSVIVNSRQLAEIFYYSREFITNINFNLCTIQLTIPYSGIRGYNTVARILLYLDNEVIYDSSIYSKEAYILRPLNLSGHKCNLLAGHHKIKLLACTNNAELHIPHLNPKGEENMIQPPISGSYLVIGFN